MKTNSGRARPTPWERGVDEVAASLEAVTPVEGWPEPDSDLEDRLFSALTLVFVEARRADRVRGAVHQAMGGERYEFLMGLLTFIRTAHYWTVLHPDLLLEAGAERLLTLNEELTQRLRHGPVAHAATLGPRLYAELRELRDLNERT